MFLLNRYENIAQYLQSVCTQIRWKRARQAVYQELECHLQDQKDAFLLEGMQEKEAEQKAIAEMGDAMSVGLALDKAHRPIPQWGLLFLTAILFLMGMCCRLFLRDGSTWTEVVPILVLSILVFLGTYFLDFTIWFRYANSIVCATICILLLGLLFQTPNINGKPQFLLFSMTSFALWLPLSYISLLYILRNKQKLGFWLAVGGYIGGICFLYPCALFSNTILFAISAGAALYMAVQIDWFGIGKKEGQKWLWVVGILCIGVGMLIFYTVKFRYYSHRLDKNDPMGNGFLMTLCSELWQSSQWIGQGIPKSVFLTNVLQNTNGLVDWFSVNDMTLLEIGFRYGKIFVVMMLVLFAVFFMKCWIQIQKQNVILANMTAKVIFLILVLQFLFDVIFQIGIPLIASFSLPLISTNYIGLLLNSALIGFLLSVFRTGQECQQWVCSMVKK